MSSHFPTNNFINILLNCRLFSRKIKFTFYKPESCANQTFHKNKTFNWSSFHLFHLLLLHSRIALNGYPNPGLVFLPTQAWCFSQPRTGVSPNPGLVFLPTQNWCFSQPRTGVSPNPGLLFLPTQAWCFSQPRTGVSPNPELVFLPTQAWCFSQPRTAVSPNPGLVFLPGKTQAWCFLSNPGLGGFSQPRTAVYPNPGLGSGGSPGGNPGLLFLPTQDWCFSQPRTGVSPGWENPGLVFLPTQDWCFSQAWSHTITFFLEYYISLQPTSQDGEVISSQVCVCSHAAGESPVSGIGYPLARTGVPYRWLGYSPFQPHIERTLYQVWHNNERVFPA